MESNNTVLVLFAAIIIVGGGLLALITLAGKRGGRRLNRAYYQQAWQAIEQGLGSDETSLQLTIIKADKLLDQALRERGFSGATMGDRLKTARNALGDSNAVWRAHKLRNRIAHETNIRLSSGEARQALAAFRGALRRLGAL